MSDTVHLQVNVVVNEGAQRHHVPLFTEIVHLAHKSGLAGASVFRGAEGFGHSHRVHTSRLFGLSGHLPVVVVIVDADQKVRAFLPRLQALVGDDGVVTVSAVEVVTPPRSSS